MRNITQAKGSALIIEAVCNADRPPASSSAAATTPSVTAQNIRCQTGGSSLPPEVMMSITSEPESDEVTKKVIINKVATAEEFWESVGPRPRADRLKRDLTLNSLLSSNAIKSLHKQF